MTTTKTAHILLDDSGVAWIDETNVKVIEVVLDRTARGWSPEEIHFQHAHLSLAQIHAALAFYYDHQDEDEVDRQIDERFDEVRRMAAQQSDSPMRNRVQPRQSSR
ncbi:MAG: DUF433 domain-containing protein [Planctomycetes bacterium]|nr:DUF433 domain-containing protein [Planctomycetota bacterium]